MKENKCEGCVYDLTDRHAKDKEEFEIILDNCLACKRAMKEEYQDKFLDLYRTKEENIILKGGKYNVYKH